MTAPPHLPLWQFNVDLQMLQWTTLGVKANLLQALSITPIVNENLPMTGIQTWAAWIRH